MIKFDSTYSDYVETQDPAYPGGKAVNAASAESTDGTPLLADWMNDINGARQALFLEAFGDINNVSGKPDNVQESDVLKAIKKITQEYTNGKVANEAQAREQGDADTLSSVKSYVDQKFIKHYQKGYIQMPGMPSPLEDTSMHYSGYSWYEINYDGNFFRAKGRNAKAFSSKKLTKEQIRNGDYIFQDDEQGDAIRDITGSFFFDFANVAHRLQGVFSEAKSGKGYLLKVMGDAVFLLQRLYFKVSNVVPTAEENRSRNLTFIYWVLVKNE